MPLYEPVSLNSEQVYALTAYILGRAGIIDKQITLNAENLSDIEMPNRHGFVSAWSASGD